MFDLQGFGSLMLKGALVTVELAVVSLFFGMILGLGGALAKRSQIWIVRQIGFIYTSLFRSIPDLLLVLFMYYGLSILLNAFFASVGLDQTINISPFVAGVMTLSLTFGAYATETLRMAISEIPTGQWEAAQALGLSKRKTFTRIILPQVWSLALPGLGNLFLVLLKDTALVSVVGLNELLRQSNVAVGNTQQPFTVFLAASLLYLLMTMVATAIMMWLERKSNPAKHAKRNQTIEGAV